MRVLFVNPSLERYTRQVATPLGLLSIATYLSKHGHCVKILDRTIKTTAIEKELMSFQPDVVGISVMSTKGFSDSARVSRTAKKYGAKVIWGGVFVSLDTDLVFNNTEDVDYVSIGEGEETWRELLEALSAGSDMEQVAGLAFRRDGKTVYTKKREFIDLATLPELDFNLIDVEKYLFSQYSCLRTFCLYISKGCIGNCTFCYNKAFHNCTYRRRPMEQFLNEVRNLVENYSVDCIYFADELWCCSREEMFEQCTAFKRSGIPFKWGVQSRIGIFKDEDFAYMKECGCEWIDFGIESGSPEMLKTIRKGIPYDRIESTFAACEQAGIISLANFIIGFPGETRQQLMETVKLAQRIKATQKTFFNFFPGPGSQLYRELVEQKKYNPPKSFRQYTNVKFYFVPKPNFSRVPVQELKTVRAHFLWQGFSRKHFSEEARTYAIAKKDIADVLKQFKGHGFRFGSQLFMICAYEFLSIFINAKFHPFIKKKYGLE